MSGGRPRGVPQEAPGPRRRVLRTAPDADPRAQARVRRQPPPEHRRRDADAAAADPRRRVPPGNPEDRRRRAMPEQAEPGRPRRGGTPMGRRASGEIHTRSAPTDPARRRRPGADDRSGAPERADRPADDKRVKGAEADATRRAAAKKAAPKKPKPTGGAGPKVGTKPSGAKPAGSKPSGSKPAGAKPTGSKPAKTPSDKTPSSKDTTRKKAPGTPAGHETPRKRRLRAGAAAASAVSAADLPADTSAGDSTTPPTGTDMRTRRGWASGAGWGRALIALASVAVLLCTGYAWNTMSDLESSITQLGGLGLGGAEDGAVDILLVGTDSRTDAQGNPLSPEEMKLLRSGDEVATNTDTILLIRIPEDGSSATAISIPRDSYVDVPGIGMSKINAAYGTTREGVRARAVEAGKSPEEAEKEGTLAGRKALVDTVAKLTGVHVDHYAEVGLLGFVLLTNAAGGVDVCLKAPVRDPYSGARFRAGVQTLDGPKALSFVRQRHGLPRGDLDRITRQQAFMASLTQKMLSAGTLTDPGKLRELQDAVARTIVIDDGWNILDFADQLKDLSGGKVKFATIPIVTEQGWSEDGQQSVVEVDPQAVKVFTDELLTPKKDNDVARGDYKVDVVNAGTIDGLGANVSNILTNKGFQPGTTSSGKADTKDSVVFAKENNDAARVLAKDLGGVKIVADDSLADDQLKVVLTNTYDGPGSINDTGDQADNVPASERVGNKQPPITAGTKGPMCVN